MVVEVSSVEPSQPVRIIREMRRGPVHNDADSCMMGGIDECHEVFWGAVAASGGKVAS